MPASADTRVLRPVAAGGRRRHPPGALAAELENGGNFRHVVHQASGMVAVQLGVAVGEALIRLRASAFANDRLLDEVADEVVGRQLRFA